MAALWTRFRTTDRSITITVAISAALHLALLLGIGSSLYTQGEDDENVPELSVQLVTRAGPSSEENTDAALPVPAPEPAQEVVDDPGNSQRTVDAPQLADAIPQQQPMPDVPVSSEDSAAPAEFSPVQPDVLTTTGESTSTVAATTEPEQPPAVLAPVPKTEQAMLTKNLQHLAQQLLDTNLTRTELTWEQDGQQYSARVMRKPAPDSTGLEQVIAEVTTNKDGKRLKTRLTLKRLAFSHFTQLINFWDPNIQLHDDIIDGRFHSNNEISIAFSGGVHPRFDGKVTTAAYTMTREQSMPTHKKSEIFAGGMETHTERISLPRDMPEVVNGGDASDRYLFAEDARIIFNPDGSFVWRGANGNGPLQRIEASDKPRYLIGEKGAKLYVRGTVVGVVTVYSPNDIEIEDDLVYAQDPRDTVLSRDFLALIAGRDIRVARGQVTGNGDLHVQAAMFARHTFRIESTQTNRVGCLYILGSLSAGTILESEPRYATKMEFDKRFEYLRPANFPMTRRYEVDSWDQDWEEVEGKEDAQAPQGLARSQ